MEISERLISNELKELIQKWPRLEDRSTPVVVRLEHPVDYQTLVEPSSFQDGYASYDVSSNNDLWPIVHADVCLARFPLSKPKNARSKRALDAREPQLVEGDKTAIFVRGERTSDKVRQAMKDLVSLDDSRARDGIRLTQAVNLFSTHSRTLTRFSSPKRTQSTHSKMQPRWNSLQTRTTLPYSSSEVITRNDRTIWRSCDALMVL